MSDDPKRTPLDAETNRALAEFFERLSRDVCPQCEQPIEPSRVVGRCKYGACGHRIGQVGT